MQFLAVGESAANSKQFLHKRCKLGVEQVMWLRKLGWNLNLNLENKSPCVGSEPPKRLKVTGKNKQQKTPHHISYIQKNWCLSWCTLVVVAEWFRWWTTSLLGCPSTGSNPADNAEVFMSAVALTTKSHNAFLMKATEDWMCQTIASSQTYLDVMNGTPKSGLRSHCRPYPYELGSTMLSTVRVLCRFFLHVKNRLTAPDWTSENSCPFYKVFKDPIITKASVIMKERQKQKMSYCWCLDILLPYLYDMYV